MKSDSSDGSDSIQRTLSAYDRLEGQFAQPRWRGQRKPEIPPKPIFRATDGSPFAMRQWPPPPELLILSRLRGPVAYLSLFNRDNVGTPIRGRM